MGAEEETKMEYGELPAKVGALALISIESYSLVSQVKERQQQFVIG